MKNEKGFALIELLVALTLMGVIAATIYTAMSSASMASVNSNTRLGAQNLAQYQMEYVKKDTYQPNYTPATLPEFIDVAYVTTITVGTVPNRDNDIQTITVVIYLNGIEQARLEDFKVRR